MKKIAMILLGIMIVTSFLSAGKVSRMLSTVAASSVVNAATSKSLFEKSKDYCERDKVEGCFNLGVMYEKGVEGAQKDMTKSFSYYNKSCKLGKAAGCANMGEFYRLGIGVAKNIPLGISYYKKACKMHHDTSCYNLGVMYKNGYNEIPKDLEISSLYYQKSCLLGSADGCYASAISFYKGTAEGGVNKKRAKGEWNKSCKLGQGKGCYMYGLSFPLGSDEAAMAFKKGCLLNDADCCTEVETSSVSSYSSPKPEKVISKEDREFASILFKKSFDIYSKECASGNANSCYGVSRYYTDDKKGVAKQLEKERLFIVKMKTMRESLCERGEFEECRSLSNDYEYGKGDVIKKDKVLAEQFNKKYMLGAIKKYEATSEMALDAGIAYIDKKNYGVQDYKKAMKIFKKGCDNNEKEFCYWLGSLYEDGYGVPKDEKKAILLKKKDNENTLALCKKGDGRSCSSVALYYRFGLGNVTKDISLAKKYQKKACDVGYADGCESLAELLLRG